MKKIVLFLSLLLFISFGVMAKSHKKPPPPPDKFIEKFDKDGDGKVSEDEFDGPADHFKKLDRNNDGYITKDELPKGPPRKKGKPDNRSGMGK